MFNMRAHERRMYVHYRELRARSTINDIPVGTFEARDRGYRR